MIINASAGVSGEESGGQFAWKFELHDIFEVGAAFKTPFALDLFELKALSGPEIFDIGLVVVGPRRVFCKPPCKSTRPQVIINYESPPSRPDHSFQFPQTWFAARSPEIGEPRMYEVNRMVGSKTCSADPAITETFSILCRETLSIIRRREAA